MPYATEIGPVDITNPPYEPTINPLLKGVNKGLAGAPGSQRYNTNTTLVVAQQPTNQLGDATEEAANVVAGVGSSGHDSDPAASQNIAPQASQLENNEGLVGDLASLEE
ncbi:hypothetical protein AnigIFM63604_006896 [Aspergillus niger]|uniref:Uncharacterized protein n=1 Tax=Aspergillus niger TaxID=5061 RepID=A0A9W6A2D0_ASPNG|nr:hypothetical protein AnigIFM63604_006896 [Aspergillus niger]